MSPDAEVEAAQSIAPQRVSAALWEENTRDICGTAATHHQTNPSSFTDLQDDACGLVEVHHLFDHWLEELAVT